MRLLEYDQKGIVSQQWSAEGGLVLRKRVDVPIQQIIPNKCSLACAKEAQRAIKAKEEDRRSRCHLITAKAYIRRKPQV